MHVSLIRKGMMLDGHTVTAVGKIVRQGKARVKVDLSNGGYRLVKPNGSLPVVGYVGNIPAGPTQSRHVSAPHKITASRREPRGMAADSHTRIVAISPTYSARCNYETDAS